MCKLCVCMSHVGGGVRTRVMHGVKFQGRLWHCLPSLVGWLVRSYINLRDQEATKLTYPTYTHHPCLQTHPHTLSCLLATQLRGQGKGRVSCDTQSDNKSKPATQAQREEAPAQCHCQGACSGYSSPGHQYPLSFTPVSVSILFSKGAVSTLIFEAFGLMKMTNSRV